MINNRNRKLHKNKGFTLVELIVVLVLLSILLALGVSGLLSWQDYSKFKQENTNAETVFYAVQNQFTEYSASGIFDEKVTKTVKSMIGHRLGAPGDSANNLFDGQTIAYEEGKYYKWEPDGSDEVALWANTPKVIASGDNKSNYQGSIYYISANSGDYDRYLSDKNSVSADTRLLFELITSYISDKSVLNGAMWVEFSPEARQVFSVCYSDKADSFTKGTSDSNGILSVLDRRENVRYDLMMGYYAVDSLSVPTVGRSRGRSVDLILVNDNTLDLVMLLDEFKTTTYTVKLYNYSGEQLVTGSALASFEIPVNANMPSNITDAAASPVETKALIDGVLKDISVPVWKMVNTSGKTEVHIVLDAADVQAQSYLYGETYTDSSIAADNKDRLLKTYSFYRFGLDMGSIRQIGCGVTEQGNTEESYTENVESPTFAYVEKDTQNNPVYAIKNGRHLYNVRFETDYKKVAGERTFLLVEDIDWKAFTGGKNGTDTNYFLNSYKPGKNVGIDYDGNEYSVHLSTGQITQANARNTADYAFPGFKVLSFGDTFSGKKQGEEGCYTISNLTITFAANMEYGVYGRAAKFEWESKDVDGSDLSSVYTLSDFGKYPEENPTSGSELHPSHKKVNRGLYPLGLFAENCGTIEQLDLNAHNVIGMQMLKTDINGDNEVLVYTNMVGGFTGDNLGSMNNLKLRNVASLSDSDIRAKEAGVSSVNGKTDVGGILGRSSWTVHTPELILEGLENYAKVSGMENVGGIIGRAFVIRNYMGAITEVKMDHFVERESYYNDGYDLYGSYNELGEYSDSKELCLGGMPVNRLDKIIIKNCKNRGDVSGDELVYHNMIYLYEDLLITQTSGNRLYERKADQNLSNIYYRCAFIGGIAGITMDGYYYDFNAGGTNWINDDRTSFENDFKNNMRVVVENCSSYRLYDEETELDVLISDGSGSFSSGNFIYDRLHHDYYAGGLVGYARLTEFKDCSNTVDDDETGSYRAFVFGRSYAGGLFGCMDLSKVIRSTLIDNRYNIVNDTNVIGVMYAGGIAGGMGIGSASQQHLSFKHPATNMGSEVSQITGFSPMMRNNGVLNRAVVLGMRREALGYDDDSLIKAQDKDAFEYIGFTQYYSLQTTSGYDAGIGGICGCARTELENCDNIQTEKDYALKLIGKSESFDEVDSGKPQNCIYGGIAVGGIYGVTPGNANMNSVNGDYSVVSAVVCGDDIVGGVVGAAKDGKSAGSKINNAYLDGAIVMGRNMVGGYIGKHGNDISANKDAYAMRNYRVYGEYAVGGIAGLSIGGSLSYNISSGSVNGDSYVGGVVGSISGDKSISGKISNVDVKAYKCFAGGIAGAVYSENKNYNNPKLDNITAQGTGVKVESGAYFAGGMFGLYIYKYRNTGNEPAYTLYDFVIDNELYDIAPNRSNPLITGWTSDIMAADPMFTILADNDIGNGALSVNRGDTALKNTVIKLNATTVSAFKPEVKASMFAGGIFGYIPSGLGITFDLEDNEISIPVETTSYNPLDDPISGHEVFAEHNIGYNVNYSYGGGIVGRIPEDTTITNAVYTGKLTKNNETTYLGQIAEVNAGTISSSVVKGFNSDGSLHDIMGGLVGLNVGTITSDNSIGEGVTLSGKKTLGALMGENRSDMSLGGWNISCGDMNVSEAGGYVGALAGINIAAIDIAGSTVRTGTVTGQASVGAYVGANRAYEDISNVIYNSSVQDFIQNRYDGDYNEYRYNIKDDIADQSNKLYVNIDLTVQNVAEVGLIAGYSEGVISDICISDSCRLSINGSCTNAGAVCGTAVSPIQETDTIGLVRCVNFIDIGLTGSSEITNAGGIVARIFAKDYAELTLAQLDNHGDIYAGKLAGGIFAVSESGDVNVSDCVNTGKVSAASDDGVAGGIAADTSSDVVIRYCRNYGLLNGSAENYGIGPEISAIGNCINAGKLSGDPASGGTATYGEIGSTEHNAEFVRDFYIDGVSEEPYTGPKLTGASNSVTINQDALTFDFNGIDNGAIFTATYPNGSGGGAMKTATFLYNEGANGAHKPLEQYYNDGKLPWIDAVLEATGMTFDEFDEFCSNVFAAYLYYGNTYNKNKFFFYMTYLKQFIETANVDNQIVDGEQYGEPEFQVGTGAEDTSHWPVQLYVYKYDSDGGDLYSLTFKRWNKYLPAGISGLMYDPLAENDRYNVFLDVDPKFMNMVDDTDNYPNTDADSETKNGFVLE